MYDRQVRATVAHGGKVVDGILKNREPANEHHRRQRGNAMKLDWLETTERADGEGSGLSLDSAHLSRLRNGPPGDPDSPSNDGQPAPVEDQATGLDGSYLAMPNRVPGEVAALIEASIAERTRRAYRTDLAHFAAWGGQLPAEPAQVASFLAAHAETLSVATLVRRIATISKAHEARGLPNPCRSEIVRATMRGVKRTRGIAQREAKPLLRGDLFRVLDAMGEAMKDARDRALLLIGFAGGFRRSEIVALNCDDVERVRQGLIVTLRRSKTDQEGAGRKVGVAFGRTRHCPVLAVDRWLAVSRIETGPVFRPVDRHGHVASERLSGQAVSLIVKERVAAASIDPSGFSGHSLRTGFATSAVQAGVSTLKIRSQTGHASDAMLARYVRDGELFVDNAAGALL